MKKLLVLMSLMLILLGSSVNAFPLSGGNGKSNATVFGIIRGSTQGDNVPIYVDLAANLENYKLVLVDDDDKFYSEKSDGGWINGINPCGYGWRTRWEYGGESCRNIRSFIIPNKATIKRLRFEPENPDNWLKPEDLTPFSINWEGIPEVSDGKVLIKFYGANKREGDEIASGTIKTVSWNFELKITNNGDENKIVKPSDFTIQDQYGWQYPGGRPLLGGRTDETQLLPGESMKFDLDVIRVSPLSRPVELRYENLKMDISAWT